jgi:hypothetical protein
MDIRDDDEKRKDASWSPEALNVAAVSLPWERPTSY